MPRLSFDETMSYINTCASVTASTSAEHPKTIRKNQTKCTQINQTLHEERKKER